MSQNVQIVYLTCQTVSPSEIPTVTFDLGEEWDDWDDFDDRHLVDASNSALTSCTTSAKPVDCYMPGTLEQTQIVCLRSHCPVHHLDHTLHYACLLCSLNEQAWKSRLF